MTQDLTALTATEAAAEIARGAISSTELVAACLDRIATLDPEIRAFVHLDRDHALAQARELDELHQRGLSRGKLHGVPVGVKDIIDTADLPTECGSPLLSGRRPWRDAAVVARLRAAGAVIIGKTVTTEFALYHPGPTRNPHDPERTPGGSSSGSAAAVAARLVPLALGTQTNGSVIRPAAYCGVVGIKPTRGLVARTGVLTLSRRLDHVGAFARTLEDIALILEVIAGPDPGDADSRLFAAPDFVRLTNESLPLPPRLAFVRTPIWERAENSARKAFEDLAASLADNVAPVDLPVRYAEAWEVHRIIMAAEVAHHLGSLVDRAGEGVSTRLQELLEEGRRVSAVEYLDALATADRLAAGLAEIFVDYHAILTPATTGVAPKGLGSTGDPAFCSLWTLTGLPAVSLPLLTDEDDMPLGVQLVGPLGDDGRLLRTARWLATRIAERKSGRRRERVVHRHDRAKASS
jgi:Asp-tRNA(Asn)/Glu-tRNA(Gln) amidotransferase A subunit family amidase